MLHIRRSKALSSLAMMALVFFLVRIARYLHSTSRRSSAAAMDDIYRQAYEQRLKEKQTFTSTGNAQASPRSPGRPSQQYGGQQPGPQGWGWGDVVEAGEYLLAAIMIAGLSFVLLSLLWHMFGRSLWHWVPTLPARFQAGRQRVREAPERLNEAVYDRYLRLRYNRITDNVSFWYHRLDRFILRYAIPVFVSAIVLTIICRLRPQSPPADDFPWEEGRAHGLPVPEWASDQLRRQQLGLNNRGGWKRDQERLTNPGIDSTLQWPEPKPTKKNFWWTFSNVPEVEDSRWDTFVSTTAQGGKAARTHTQTITVSQRDPISASTETETITVYTRDEGPASTSTQTITVYTRDEEPDSTSKSTITAFAPEPATYAWPPALITQWITFVQPFFKTRTITEHTIKTYTDDPTTETETITVEREVDKEPSILTSFLTQTIPTTETITVEREGGQEQEPSVLTSYITETIPITETITVERAGGEEQEPSIFTSWLTRTIPTIVANVTPTTIYSIYEETITSLRTVTIPGTTLTETIQGGDQTVTIPGTTLTETIAGENQTITRVVERAGERETGLPVLGEDGEEEEKVRRGVETKVWCKTCQQWHCCQVPYH